ncbi:MAG: biotin/lipoyl-binding protein [Magnetospirillum sp.]|nr:biotin/lipoyl-binding protein [Magnetospirillum sp.]
MLKKLRITVEGKVYDVTVEELTEAGHAAPLYPSIAGTGASTSVATSGPLNAPLPVAPAAAQAGAAGDELSPLGGVVESLDVAVGQAVAEGDKVAVIEAMKMKTPIYAHRSGTVTRIAVKPGDPVEAGHVILTIG